MKAQNCADWANLRRDYSLAEQLATNGFTKTVVFEPWGGRFVVTRAGAQIYGWTNSQPLDRIDGYDLLTKEGEELLFDLKLDPRELTSILDKQPAAVGVIREQVKSEVGDLSQYGVNAEVDASTEAALRALGYVE